MTEGTSFELKIISPDGMFYEGENDFLEFASVEGRMGIYKNHIPLTTILAPCVAKLHRGSEVRSVEISGGFAEILKDRVTILAESVKWSGQAQAD